MTIAQPQKRFILKNGARLFPVIVSVLLKLLEHFE